MNPSDLFAFPAALPLLLLVPLVWLLFLALDRASMRRFSRVVGPRAPVLAPEWAAGQRRMRRTLAVAGFLLALVALLQPVWGEDVEIVQQRGVDLLVCLDVSQSMLARDLAPTRLECARREIGALSSHIRGDRLGLVVFAGEARLSVPLTQDMVSFAELVGLADPLSVGRGGTDLGAALETALVTLEGQSGEHEVILLITDGEDLEGRGLRVAEKCRERGLTVHCVGFGSPQGSKIAVAQRDGEVFLRDRSGNEVVTAMDPVSLRKLAETTGGEFVEAGIRPRPLVELYEKRVVPMSRKALAAEVRRTHKNRFQWPLLAAYLLWVLEVCLTDRRR
ncbi:MAG: VWA domain-containing protein [Planctomycetota bacterium]